MIHTALLRGSLVDCIKKDINPCLFLNSFSHPSYKFYYPYIYSLHFHFTTIVLYLTQFSSCKLSTWPFYGLSFFSIYVWLLQKSNVMSGGYVTECSAEGKAENIWGGLCCAKTSTLTKSVAEKLFSVYFLLFPYPKIFSHFFSSHWKK